MNRPFHRSRSLVALAALVVSGAVFAQSSALTAPNNSAGTPLDTPPMAAPPATGLTGTPTRTESVITAFDKLDGGNGYVTRHDTDRLPGTVNFDEADRNRDGRLDAEEFQRFWGDYQGAGQ